MRLGVVDELLPAETFGDGAPPHAWAPFPRDAYAHTKMRLVSEAIARTPAETREEQERATAVWSSKERAAQRRKLGMKG
jgi:hypothetical protein